MFISRAHRGEYFEAGIKIRELLKRRQPQDAMYSVAPNGLHFHILYKSAAFDAPAKECFPTRHFPIPARCPSTNPLFPPKEFFAMRFHIDHPVTSMGAAAPNLTHLLPIQTLNMNKSHDTLDGNANWSQFGHFHSEVFSLLLPSIYFIGCAISEREE